jgi:4a-hydroxytetrahydrobiopterin dehydratase
MSAQPKDSLVGMKCVACKGEEPKATEQDIASWKPQVPEWEIIEDSEVKKLRRTFKFKDFAQALAFVNRVGALAEAEDHHPLIEFTWGKATVIWWTHKIGGLHRNDFIMAAKTDEASQAGG